jgi:phenylpropionate dioxygenase-like ring-hydroxylating dioxygenase large terminal subunit
MNVQPAHDIVSVKGAPLLGFWYPAVPSDTLRRSSMQAVTMLDLPILLCRDREGRLSAMRDICPHRGMPLSFGRFDWERVECPYHGWQFDTAGRCRRIPALVQGDTLQTDKVGLATYPVDETDGMIWIYVADDRGQNGSLPPAPCLPLPSEPQQSFHISLTYTCTPDDGIIGLIDPVHGPYVHSWWRSDARMHEKAKTYEPIPNGFRMVAHQPAKNSGPFHWLQKIYGGPLTTTIDFVLPNQRVELMRCGTFWVANRLMATPVNEMECRIHFSALWHGLNWVPFGNFIFRTLTKMFLSQDERAMKNLAVGLRHKPSSMFLGDADMPAKWYYKLKAAYLTSVQTGQPMDHPLKERVTLRWRS